MSAKPLGNENISGIKFFETEVGLVGKYTTV